jgi:DNA-directed RNA polymerase subunit RPC12/RpoP
MRVELACAECGGNNFSIDEARSDNCEVHCGDCGHRIGTLAELKDKVAQLVLATAPPRSMR